MPIKKRSKEEKDKSARAVAKTINTTTPTHGRPGSWGNVPGLFGEDVLEPELEVVETIEEEALEPELNEDVLWLAYQHELDDGQIQKISLKFEGFGFTGKMAEIEKNPLHDEFCDLMQDLAKKIWEFDE